MVGFILCTAAALLICTRLSSAASEISTCNVSSVEIGGKMEFTCYFGVDMQQEGRRKDVVLKRTVKGNSDEILDCYWVDNAYNCKVKSPRFVFINKITENVTVSLNKASIEEDEGQYICEVVGREAAVCNFTLSRAWMFSARTPISMRVERGKGASFSFVVTSNTMDASVCQLTTPSGVPTVCNSKKSEFTVRGSPPRFDVTVTVKDVREQDTGTWKLTAGNPGGEDNLDFQLSLESETQPFFHAFVGVCTALLIVLAIIAVFVIFAWRRHWKLPCAGTPFIPGRASSPGSMIQFCILQLAYTSSFLHRGQEISVLGRQIRTAQ